MAPKIELEGMYTCSNACRSRLVTDNLTDILGCQAACYDWADSYDSKDWKKLEGCIAPTLRVSTSTPPESREPGS